MSDTGTQTGDTPATGTSTDATSTDTSTETKDEGSETEDPTNTVEYWKKHSRENEKKAKANAAAAKKLAELEEASKSEEDKRAEAARKIEGERDEARREAAIARAALKYGLSEEDLDLISGGDPEEIEDRAKRLSERISAPANGRKPDPTLGREGAPKSDPDAWLRDLARR